jgi:hypothetical protein
VRSRRRQPDAPAKRHLEVSNRRATGDERSARDPSDAQRMMRLHVDGTRRVLERMAAAGVRRMVLASTSGTIGVSRDEAILDESAPYAEDIVAGWPYYASKIFQERLAFEHGKRLGIEVVAVNPSLLLGPGDRRLSSTGDVRKFLRREIPTIPDGGISFVDARDAAAATASALDRGRTGERYLLGGPNWTTKEFFARLGRIADVAPPRLKLPASWARWGAGVMEELYRWRGKQPPVDRISVEMAEHYYQLAANQKNVSPEALVSLAAIYERLNRLPEATQLTDQALQLKPGFPEALLVRARLNRQAGRLDNAAEQLRSFPKTSGYDVRARALYELGGILDRQGNYEEAMAAFLEAKSLLLPSASRVSSGMGRSSAPASAA